MSRAGFPEPGRKLLIREFFARRLARARYIRRRVTRIGIIPRRTFVGRTGRRGGAAAQPGHRGATGRSIRSVRSVRARVARLGVFTRAAVAVVWLLARAGPSVFHGPLP